eukprot:1853089-Rhodomonas_salina.1
MSAKRVYLTTKSYEFLRVLHSPVLKSEHGNTTPQHSHSNKNYFLEASNSLGVPSQEFLGIAMRITRGWYTCTPGTDEKRLSTSVRVSENTLVGRHRVRNTCALEFGHVYLSTRGSSIQRNGKQFGRSGGTTRVPLVAWAQSLHAVSLDRFVESRYFDTLSWSFILPESSRHFSVELCDPVKLPDACAWHSRLPEPAEGLGSAKRLVFAPTRGKRRHELFVGKPDPA